MPALYHNLIRPALFAQDSERIHDRTLRGLEWCGHRRFFHRMLRGLFGAPPLPIQRLGLEFPNPVGLAAGMDKRAAALPVWEQLGFGFCELGGVTWHPQAGNPKPRIHRAVPDRALINRMGFNNPGALAVAEKLGDWKRAGLWPRHPVGINLGKSKIAPLENAAEDYASSFRALRSHADFFVVNVSSPNTPNLRQLQDKAALEEILAALREAQSSDAVSGGDPSASKTLPILVKVAPDLSFEALDEILELAGPRGVAGIVATNTTITRPGTGNPDLRRIYSEPGGLSGAPLRVRSTEVVKHLFRQTRGTLPIIGVGGIFNANDAWEKIAAGASLLQIYTGLIYEGPGVVREIVRGLRTLLVERGFDHLSQAVGSEAK